MTFKLTIVGCGDAFGSGGRLQTGYHVDLGHHRFLIDCGATSLIGLDKLRLDPNAISTIFISHLHGDHLHPPSLRRLGSRPRIVVPRGAGEWVRRKGIDDVVELGVGDTLT
ncbi:MAG: MBL fold metallo-hydrolase, partial [Hyphomicrobium sp.]|nr:MBL fold metallo-hydrolase [Hyphomicrobium sp.]